MSCIDLLQQIHRHLLLYPAISVHIWGSDLGILTWCEAVLCQYPTFSLHLAE